MDLFENEIDGNFFEHNDLWFIMATLLGCMEYVKGNILYPSYHYVIHELNGYSVCYTSSSYFSTLSIGSILVSSLLPNQGNDSL